MLHLKRFLAIGFLLVPSVVICKVGYAELLIDNFNGSSNLLGGRTGVYQKAPSKSLAMQTPSEYYGSGGKSLMLKYDKKIEGGPYGMGGWCGYYTLLKSGSKYLDASDYEAFTFYVKGAKGGENFKIGVADRHWDKIGDSLKSEDIGSYLPAGEITKEWQKATVPLDVFFLDLKELASFAICFETDYLAGEAARGTVYIDELKLE